MFAQEPLRDTKPDSDISAEPFRVKSRGRRVLKRIPRWLMNSTVVRRNVMEYRDQTFRYEADELLEPDSEHVRQVAGGKQYIQKRSVRPKRRKSPKAAHPGVGMGGRRNRAWTW